MRQPASPCHTFPGCVTGARFVLQGDCRGMALLGDFDAHYPDTSKAFLYFSSTSNSSIIIMELLRMSRRPE